MVSKIKYYYSKKGFFKHIIYILYIILEKIVSIMYFFTMIIPINRNKIVFCSAKGKRYGDNPMYISNALNTSKNKYEIVWLLNKDVEIDVPQGVKRINNNIFSEMFHLVTAKVWVDSNLKYSWVLKRSGQLYIQTWHGSYGIKKIGYDLGNRLTDVDKRNHDKNSKLFDVMISNSKQTTDIYRRAFQYQGKFLEYGSPRNDIFFGEKEKYIESVKKYFNINNKRIVLYAPTYRADYGLDKFELDYNNLIRTLEDRFGDEWVVLIRLHPYNLQDAEKLNIYNDNILNASNYSIMQELLVAADILITDYSSCMFDFVTTGKVCFLYAIDVKEYGDDRDYYFDIRDLPFPLAENNEELNNNIIQFDEEAYANSLNVLFDNVGLHETGEASKKVADYIERWMEDN